MNYSLLPSLLIRIILNRSIFSVGSVVCTYHLVASGCSGSLLQSSVLCVLLQCDSILLDVPGI